MTASLQSFNNIPQEQHEQACKADMQMQANACLALACSSVITALG